MRTAKATKGSKIQDIYRENLIPHSGKNIYQYQWIKAIDSKARPLNSNESANHLQKNISKTKPFQIKHGIEDLDQRNRQVRSILYQTHQKNKDLKAKLQIEEAALIDFTEFFNEVKKGLAKSRIGSTSQRELSAPISKNNHNSQRAPSNLDKNLEMQIHLSDIQIKKLESKLQTIRSSEPFYELMSLTHVNEAYFEECARLRMLKSRLDEMHAASLDERCAEQQQEMKDARDRIYKLNDKVNLTENEILKAEKFIRDLAFKKRQLIQEKTSVITQCNMMASDINGLDGEIARYQRLISEVQER